MTLLTVAWIIIATLNVRVMGGELFTLFKEALGFFGAGLKETLPVLVSIVFLILAFVVYPQYALAFLFARLVAKLFII